MIIEDKSLGRSWRIDANENSFTIQKRVVNKKNGEILWLNEGYFTTLYSAIIAITKRRVISENSKMTISKYLKEYKRIVKEIIERS